MTSYDVTTDSRAQRALSRHYSSAHRVILVDCDNGDWALFSADGKLLALDWWEHLQGPAVRRPIPVPQARPSAAERQTEATKNIAQLLGLD